MASQLATEMRLEDASHYAKSLVGFPFDAGSASNIRSLKSLYIMNFQDKNMNRTVMSLCHSMYVFVPVR